MCVLCSVSQGLIPNEDKKKFLDPFKNRFFELLNYSI